MRQPIDKSIELLDNMRLIYGLNAEQLEALNQGISALLVIKDGHYKLDTSTNTFQLTNRKLTTDEITSTLRALANVIEKGV